MNNPSRAHYQTLLAPIYGWMLGEPELAFARSSAELTALGIGPAQSGARALDLGAGTGLQSVPLCAAGYAVTAIDSCAELLAELRTSCPSATTVLGDIAELDTLPPQRFDVIVCMGDTITHLPSRDVASRMLASACERLTPGGVIALTFRDYVSRTLEGAERFILVRGDEDRILTCFLEYLAEFVHVTDLVHERSASGWSMRKSTYPKLRLALDWVCGVIEAHGCTITMAKSVQGRLSIAARRR